MLTEKRSGKKKKRKDKEKHKVGREKPREKASELASLERDLFEREGAMRREKKEKRQTK